MKKLFTVLLMMSFLVCGCGGTDTSQPESGKTESQRDETNEILSSETEMNREEQEDSEKESEEQKGSEQESEILNDDGEVEILAEYTLADGIGWYTRHFIVIKNNSSETVEVSTSSLAYAEDGSMVGAGNAGFDALGAGCTSVLYEAIETDVKIDHYDTKLTASKSAYYESVIQDLSFVQNDIENGAIFQVTNNGEDVAEFVKGYALFFKDGELVDYEDTYFTDDDSEIKPKDTISKQMTAYDEFDTIEFYLDGRK